MCMCIYMLYSVKLTLSACVWRWSCAQMMLLQVDLVRL